MHQKRFGEKKIKSSNFKERTEEHFKSKKRVTSKVWSTRHKLRQIKERICKSKVRIEQNNHKGSGPSPLKPKWKKMWKRILRNWRRYTTIWWKWKYQQERLY